MTFLVDAQLPPVLAEWIATGTHKATHVFDIGLERAKDETIWEHARDEKAVLMTKDEDFVPKAFRD